MVLTTAQGVAAQDGDTFMRNNVRCVLASSILLIDAKDPAVVAALQSAMFLSVGRIDGRNPGFDMASALKRELPYIESTGAAKEFERCAEILRARTGILSVHFREADKR